MGYLLHRIAVGLYVLGFLMVPALILLHFCSQEAAIVLIVCGAIALLIQQIHAARQAGRTLLEQLSSPADVGWQLHPAITVGAGALFVTVGGWVTAYATVSEPEPGKTPMTATECVWFGTGFVLLGTATCLSSLAAWWVQRRPESGPAAMIPPRAND